MDRLIKTWEGKSFSGDDIYRLCDSKVSVRKYRDLANFRSMKQALGRHTAMIILYETKDGYGHWCAVFEVDPKTLEFFDPYGISPDGELSFINPQFREISGQLPYLSALIKASRYSNIVYNREPLQRFSSDMNTCGRWCGLRVCLRQMPLKQFIGLFRKQKFPPDWYVTALTMFV